jgi:hypothetical protein
MQLLLDEYYKVRRQNETLKGNITLLQAELKRVKENYDYVVNMSNCYKDITEEEKMAEINSAKERIDYEYDTGRIIPRDDSQNWG